MGQSGSQDRNALEVLFTQFPNKLEFISRGEGNENQFWKLYEADFMYEDHRSENSAASLVSNLAAVNGENSSENSKPNSEKRKCSIFEFKTNSEYFLKYTPDQRNIAQQCARNAIRRVKQFRHPNIIKYLDSYDKNTAAPNTPNLDQLPQILLATELVTPLRLILPSLEKSEILYGLSQIVSAIEWLHKQCNIVYNNLHLDSIYVSQDKQMRWLLGDFQFATEYNTELTESFISETQRYRYADAITPEEGMLKFKKFKIHSRDAYALGKLIETISTINTAFNIPIPSSLVDPDPAKRTIISASSFMRGDIFCEVMNVFDDLRVKESVEKEHFFRNLDKQIGQIPANLVRKRLLHRMLSFPFVIEPSASHFLPFLFTVKGNGEKLQGVLEKADFNKYVIPFIERCLESKNRALRSRVLSVLENFVGSLDPNYVINKLFPEIVIGLKDTSDDLVMYSMNAAVLTAKFASTFTDKLFESINNVIKVLHHYATFEQNSDALRSHALVCLVELWSLSKISKSIIYSALYHSLYNPTSYEMKIHTLNVILMHLKSFSAKELASVIIKLVTDFVLHERLEVRNKALSVLQHATEVLMEMPQEMFENENYGMLSRNQKPSPILILQPNFPVESTYPLERRALFSGNGPRIGELAEIKTEEETISKKQVISTPSIPLSQQAAKQEPIVEQIREEEEEDTHEDVPVQPVDITETPKLVVSKREGVAAITEDKAEDEEQEDWNQDTWDKEEEDEQTTEHKPVIATISQELVTKETPTIPINSTRMESPSKKLVLSSAKINKGDQNLDSTTASTKSVSQQPLRSKIEDDEPLKVEDNEPDYFSEMGMNVPQSVNTVVNSIPVKKSKKKSKILEEVKSVENSPSGPSAMAEHMEKVEELNDEVLSGWGESIQPSSVTESVSSSVETGEKKKKKKKKKDLFTPFDTSVIDSFISTLPPDASNPPTSTITSNGDGNEEGGEIAKSVILSSFGEEKKKRKVGKKKAP